MQLNIVRIGLVRFALLGALALGLPGCSSSGDERPNVLLLTLDTTRADRLGCYGRNGSVTPYLDRLAQEGVRFAEARCQVPITLPSHTSMLTGVYPATHGVHQHSDVLDRPDLPTLAEILQRNGYRTAAFLAARVLERKFGLLRGFDHYEDDFGATADGDQAFGRRASVVTEKARHWFSARPEGPFFAWLHFFDPHLPYQPKEPFKSRYPDDPYDAEVAYMDQQIGEFLRWLKIRGDLENTIVVAIADHGESLGEHGIIGHTEFVYREVLWIPFVMSWPGRIEGGQTVADLVRSIDLLPTLLDLLELGIPEVVEGRSLHRLLDGKKEKTGRDSFFESRYLENLFGWAPLMGVESWPLKLIRAPRPELYDVAVDPQEMHNLYSPAHPRGKILDEQLATFVADHVAAADQGGDEKELDQQTRQALASLGYVSGSTGSMPKEFALEDPKDHIETIRLYQQIQTGPQAGSTEAELETARLVSELEPNHPQILKLYGDFLVHFERLDEAEVVFRRVADIVPEDPDPWVQMAAIARARGDEQVAREHLSRAQGLDSDDARVLFEVGEQAFRDRRFPEAEKYLRQALDRDATNLEAMTILGMIYMEGRRFQEAGQILARSFEMSPLNNTELAQRHYLMGRALHSQGGGNPEALRHLEKAAQLAPGLRGPFYYLAVIHADQGRRSEAVRNANRYLELSPAQDPGAARMQRIVAGQ